MVCGDLKSTGLIVWINKNKVPDYVKDVISISSKVFDNLYVITDNKKLKNKDNIRYLDLKVVQSNMIDKYPYSLLDYQEIADYIAYNSIEVLSWYGIDVDSVFKFDADLIPYNKFLINQITNNSNFKPFVATERSHYLENYGESFYNCCLTFFNKTEASVSLSKFLVREWAKVIEDRDHKYTATGPSMLNRLAKENPIDLDICDKILVSIDTLKPTMPKFIEMKDSKLGIHLEMSTYKRNKLLGSSDNIRIALSQDTNLIKLIY